MGIFVATNAVIFFGSYDLTSDTNEVTSAAQVAEVDVTSFGSGGAQDLKGGIRSSSIDLKTFLDTALTGSETAAFAQLATQNNLVSVCPTGAANDRAMFARALESKAHPGLKVGDAMRLDVHCAVSSAEQFLEGWLLQPKTTQTTTGTGTPQAEIAVSSTQKVYGGLHVFSASGTTPTLAVTVESAALIGFGSPTTRLTFATQTTAGSDFQSTAGAITDANWRVKWTVGGTTPSFTFAVVIAIQ